MDGGCNIGGAATSVRAATSNSFSEPYKEEGFSKEGVL